MTYKVALSGAGGTGKTTIIDTVAKSLRSRGCSVAIIQSPTRYVKSLGFDINRDGSWKTQLLSVTNRVSRQIEALKEKPDFVLADRCLLDEMSYTLHHIKTLSESSSDYLEEIYDLTRLRQVQELTRDFLMEDLEKFWDQVYYKPRHPDYPPEGDGDRTSELKYQIEIETCFEELQLSPGVYAHIRPLPQDINESVDFIWADTRFRDILAPLVIPTHS